MDLTLLRKALNLGDDVSDADVMVKASAFVQEQAKNAQGATGQLAAVTAQLSAHGLALNDGKVVKLAQVQLSTAPVDTDDPEKAEMRAALAKVQHSTGTTQVKAAQTLIDDAIKGGKIGDKLKAPFTKLASIGAEAPMLALAQDGRLLQEKFSDALSCVTEILNGLPKLTGDQLTQLATVKPEDQKGGTTGDQKDGDRKLDKKELSAIAERSMTRTELAARAPAPK